MRACVCVRVCACMQVGRTTRQRMKGRQQGAEGGSITHLLSLPALLPCGVLAFVLELRICQRIIVLRILGRGHVTCGEGKERKGMERNGRKGKERKGKERKEIAYSKSATRVRVACARDVCRTRACGLTQTRLYHPLVCLNCTDESAGGRGSAVGRGMAIAWVAGFGVPRGRDRNEAHLVHAATIR